MKILQTIGGMAASGGGTSSCTAQLFEAMAELDPQVRLLTVAPSSPTEDMLGAGSAWLMSVPNDYRTPFCLSRNFRHEIGQSGAELFHTNGLWMDVNHITCSEARRRKRPYVITPHGMLYPEAMHRSRWKKLPLELLWFRKEILNADCIHVTCEKEMDHVRRYGYRGPVAVIGNPVVIPSCIGDIISSPAPDDTETRTVGFLGRLHPIKQVERILQGMALLPPDSRRRLRFAVMGSGDEAYERYLVEQTHRLGLTGQVEFKGFVSGRRKFEELSRLSALMVPSEMENFGMIVPEALLVNTPVMASTGTMWNSLDTERCGWWRPASAESIAGVLREILAATPGELRGMGRRGAEMVRRQYAAPIIAAKMLALYRWILGGGEKPEFVYTL